MPQQRVRELSNMEIDEISLVDRPANQYASVLIAKRDDSEEDVVPEVYDADGNVIEDIDALEVGTVVYNADNEAFQVALDDEESEVEVDLTDDAEDEGDESDEDSEVVDEGELVGKGLMQSAGTAAKLFGRGVSTGSKGSGVSAARNAGAFVGRNKKAIGIGAGAATATGVGGAVAGHQFGKSASFADEIRESLSKALGDAERDEIISKALEQVEDLSKGLAEAQEIAKSERDLRLSREYVEVAKSYNVPVDPDELGPVLMRMAEVLPDEDLAVVHKALTAAGEALYAEVGFIGGGDNLDPMSQVEAIIESDITKSEGGISKAAAVADFFATNPAAYDEYLASRRGF